jgi:hypothetical protein
MYDDDHFYVDDLVLVFLRNVPQFYQILVQHYWVSKKTSQFMCKSHTKMVEKLHQKGFIDMNKNLLKSNMTK